MSFAQTGSTALRAAAPLDTAPLTPAGAPPARLRRAPPRPARPPRSTPARLECPPAACPPARRPPAESSPQAAAHPGRALAALLGALFLGNVDVAIANIACPAIHRHGCTPAAASFELIVSGYTLAYAVLLVTGARLGQARGYRPVFLAGLGGFVIASLACGLAPNATLLVAAKGIRGRCRRRADGGAGADRDPGQFHRAGPAARARPVRGPGGHRRGGGGDGGAVRPPPGPLTASPSAFTPARPSRIQLAPRVKPPVRA